MSTAQVEIPEKLIPLFEKPLGSYRYRGAHGGRGSAKSRSFALMAAVFGYHQRLRVVCGRELQASIKESFYAEVKKAIESLPWLSYNYEVGENFIRGKNGTEFLFKGLRHNMSSIKSMADIDLFIVEEAEDVPENSWRELIPTVRNEGSEIWVIWNKRMEGSPTDQRFIKSPQKNSAFVEMNWQDNPWFPDVLNQERLNDLERLDYATYHHIWEGGYLKNSKAQIFSGKFEVKEFDKNNSQYYQGLDYGFSRDPMAAIRCFIKDDCLYISHEAGGTDIGIDMTAGFILEKMPEFEKFYTRADNSRPETTSYLKRHGLPLVQSVDKWQGSVEDGITFLKSFKKIYIHPECKETAREFMLYSYKVDRLSGDILPEIVDAYNHYIDAVRYALAPIIKNKVVGAFKSNKSLERRGREKENLRW
jgi:phage terminase large subunit